MGPQSTFQQQESQRPEDGTELQTIPYGAEEQTAPDAPLEPTSQGEAKKTRGLFRSPQLADPRDRTALRRADAGVYPAVYQTPAEKTQEDLDAEGWRPAARSN